MDLNFGMMILPSSYYTLRKFYLVIVSMHVNQPHCLLHIIVTVVYTAYWIYNVIIIIMYHNNNNTVLMWDNCMQAH